MWNPSDVLLSEYLAGRCAADDARAIERWVAEAPANRDRLAELQKLWQTPWPPAEAVAEVDTMWAGLREVIRADRERAVASRPVRTFEVDARRRWWMPLATAAAIAAVVAGAAIAGLRTVADTGKAVAEPVREYVTLRGQRSTVQLSDGTRLMLAAASRLRVPADYGRSVREVFLEGEAFASVVHDPTRPFRVRSKDAVVEDIGTQFDVRAYPEDEAVTVAVAEGAVALGRAARSSASRRRGDVAQGILLRRGDVGTLAPDGRVMTATGAAADVYFAWTKGHLSFVETPLPEVLRTIRRWYDLDVRIDSPALAARTVSAEFTTQSPNELVQALALALDARVQWTGKVVTLQSKS